MMMNNNYLLVGPEPIQLFIHYLLHNLWELKFSTSYTISKSLYWRSKVICSASMFCICITLIKNSMTYIRILSKFWWILNDLLGALLKIRWWKAFIKSGTLKNNGDENFNRMWIKIEVEISRYTASTPRRSIVHRIFPRHSAIVPFFTVHWNREGSNHSGNMVNVSIFAASVVKIWWKRILEVMNVQKLYYNLRIWKLCWYW